MIKHIDIKLYDTRNLMVITGDYNIYGMYDFLKEFLFNILKVIFQNSDILLVTINPQKDALGYQIGKFKNIKIEKDKLLVNSISNVDDILLTQIAQCQEFELGAMVIMRLSKDEIENCIKIAYKYLKEDIELSNAELPYIFCYCERDGYIIYLVNTNLSKEEIVKLVNK